MIDTRHPTSDPSPGEVIEAAVHELSGAGLAGYLQSVPALADLDGYSLVEVIGGWEKVARFGRAQVLRAVGELASRRGVPAAATEADYDENPKRPAALPPADHTDVRAPQVAMFAASEVSLALGTSHAAATGLLSDAVALTSRLPTVLSAVQAGRLHEASAHVIASETLVLDAGAAARVAEAILARGALRTVPQIKRATRLAVARVDPAGAAVREARAVKGRFVRPRKAVEDGMVAWEAWLPVADSVAIWDRLDALAGACKAPGDPRGVDARRADIAVDLLLGRPVLTPDGRELNDGATSYAKVWRTDLIVAASTVAGLDDHPGLVPGWGAVTAPTARLLASGVTSPPVPDLGGDPQWRRILTDPASGLVKDYGATRYRPPQALADYVRARDGRCYEPYCLCSAWRGDLDHIRNSPLGPSPNPDPGGRTAAENFGAGCRRGHTTKAAPGWHVACPSEGTFVWTTPTGHHYTREPEPPIDWHGTTAPDPPEPEPAVETELDPPF